MCIECSSGTYSAAGASSCLPCPAGSSCYDPAQSPEACAEGYHSAQGASNCTACPIGMWAEDIKHPNTMIGARSSPLRTSCINCPAGYACPDPLVGPVPCDPGYYSTNGTNVACTICPAGYSCYSASAPPQVCPYGIIVNAAARLS